VTATCGGDFVVTNIMLGYAGGVGLADGRVVFCPRKARDLAVWDAGCGTGFGRDVMLSGFWNKL
jgi:hypothetical protein